jgi:antitoxin component of RelBE/YafQ-DinJ toxin-antitoxin module
LELKINFELYRYSFEMTQKVRSNVYLDSELKATAKELFKSYGLSFSDGLNLLLKQATDRKTPILNLDIEPVLPDEADYKLMHEVLKKRKNGQKFYSLDEVAKELNLED